ncbi:hypothetical protein [Streptosporangium amethystogenes]|uniref:hypothetical protein n=1 Tax=Streptosporangium amethystogenes TaxID=2002 RepID=UPI0012F884AC|nr:hypothetical protein [Streptosporangium amethystogenes]
MKNKIVARVNALKGRQGVLMRDIGNPAHRRGRGAARRVRRTVQGDFGAAHQIGAMRDSSPDHRRPAVDMLAVSGRSTPDI